MKRISTKAGLALLLLAVGSLSVAGLAVYSRQSQSVQAARPAPAIALAGRVTDAADILKPAEKAVLDARLEALERATAHQMVVVTVPSLQGREVSAFTRDLANDWGIGRARINDGVVVLIAPKERKARIEVGKGLEKKLPDALCAKIMRERLLPNAGKGKLAAALTDTVDALDLALRS